MFFFFAAVEFFSSLFSASVYVAQLRAMFFLCSLVFSLQWSLFFFNKLCGLSSVFLKLGGAFLSVFSL